jgi:hypothetical protein
MHLLLIKKWLTTKEQRKYYIEHFRGRPGLVVVRFWWSPTSTNVMGWVSSLYDDFEIFDESENKSSNCSESYHTVTFDHIVSNLINFNLRFWILMQRLLISYLMFVNLQMQKSVKLWIVQKYILNITNSASSLISR